MQYRKMQDGSEVSVLGYGCMRFSRKGPVTDVEKAEKEIMRAYEAGVNYYDTAYIYPGSEAVLGEILERNKIREKVYIATKLPHYMIKSVQGAEKIFQEELKRLRTDYIDYYLMHMLDDVESWNNLVKMGLLDWLKEKKASGAIRHLGFSYHGKTEGFKALLDAYDWEFCQVQYNYMDEHSQAGRAGVEYAYSKGIPVIIMEGLRGGRLVNLLPEAAKKRINSVEGMNPARLAFKWLYDQPEVTCVLSGMNSMEMVEENLITAETAVPGCMTESDKQLVADVKAEIEKSIKVGCTGCGYCMPCPKGVDIPLTFRCYNEIYTENKRQARHEYAQCTVFKKNVTSASLCVECGKCEKHCPQHLEIRKELKNAVKELEPVSYKLLRKGISLFKLWG
ncbi:MAG: aldo/keto reductase [Lachnospiraceae bacterium]|nr:aldo/keto reductase [Lachnospiraceae bacterium]